MKNRRRLVLWAAGGAAAAALIALASRPRPVAVELAPVVRGTLTVTLDEEGETRVRDRFLISAPVAGRVLRIELEPGDPVLADESVLASFQPAAPMLLDQRRRAETEAEVEAAAAGLGRTEALYQQAVVERAQAESTLDRLRRLLEAGVIAEERLETAQRERNIRQEALEAAEFSVRNQRGILTAARARLLRFDARRAGSEAGGAAVIRIFSPVDGVVLRRLRESESVVPAGEALIEVGDPEELEVVADYLSTDAVRIRAGQPALIERWGGDRPLGARVLRVEPSGFTKISALGVEEQRVLVVLELVESAATRPGLGDGYRVEARVVVWEREAQLKVPVGALFRRGEQWAVFRVEDGAARERTIEIGERNQREAQVLAGLEAGDQVLVYPGERVADGVRIASAGPVEPAPE